VRDANKDPEFKKRSVTDLQYDGHIGNTYYARISHPTVGGGVLQATCGLPLCLLIFDRYWDADLVGYWRVDICCDSVSAQRN